MRRILCPTVLVVDDDLSLRRYMCRALELHGYQVREAANAQEARQVLGDGTLDLVIMDLVLPGMQGWEAANLLHARMPDLPILYVSGYTSPESLQLGHSSDGEAFLRKPFDAPTLLAAVARMLP